MNNFIQRWRAPLAIITGMHGIGHVLFLAPLLGIADWGQSTQSWLLAGSMGQLVARVAGSALWVVAIAGFVAAVAGVLAQASWWRRLAAISALSSLAGVLLFWNSTPTSPVICAAIFDVAMLVVVSLARSQRAAVSA